MPIEIGGGIVLGGAVNLGDFPIHPLANIVTDSGNQLVTLSGDSLVTLVS